MSDRTIMDSKYPKEDTKEIRVGIDSLRDLLYNLENQTVDLEIQKALVKQKIREIQKKPN
jgi:hypothetical protein